MMGARLGFDLDAVVKRCLTCGCEYKPGYGFRTRKYCSWACSLNDPATADARQKRSQAAARVAAERRTANARVRLCAECGARLPVGHNVEYRTKTCGAPACKSAAIKRAIAAMPRRRSSKKDQNHGEIVRALEAGGVATIDCSDKGSGFPDLIVCRRGVTHLVEIKNPTNSYGKQDANKNQKAWALRWPAPVYVLRSIDDVEAFIAGRFGALKVMGSPDEAVRAVLGADLTT